MPQMTIKISKMSCQHCANRVIKALEGISGVKDVRVDLKAGTATFERSEGVKMEEIARAIKEAGYQVVR